MVMQVNVQTEPRVHHEIVLQGVGSSQLQDKPNSGFAEGLKPVILKRTDPDFIAGILTELAGDRGVADLSGQIQPSPNQELTLLQPVHRTFYVAMLEVVCDPLRNPHLQSRLDPQKIESAGLVVRRIFEKDKEKDDLLESNLSQSSSSSKEGTSKPIHMGWRQQRIWNDQQRKWTRSQSWVEFVPPLSENEDLDPDPSRRPRQTVLHPEIDRFSPKFSETVSSLFVAPPEICTKTGRTILYGLIPVTSFEVSESPPLLPNLTLDKQYQLDRLIKRLYLPYYLHRGKSRPETNAGNRFIVTAVDAILTDQKRFTVTAVDAILTDQSSAENRHLTKFITSLQHLKLQFNAFEQADFLLLLNQLSITTQTEQVQPLGDFLQQAARILVDREEGTFEMPLMWSKVSSAQSQAIVEMMRSQWMNHLAKITAGEGRYDDLTARYQVRAFVRVKSPDSCPPKITWSEYSNPFTIAPWYANNPDLPPVRITLPDVLDAKAIAAIKPNVAFAVPPRLFNFLRDNDDLKKLLDGKGSNSDDSGFDWICSFNIPIITLCAYIVLNLFLKLFNFVFWWLFSIKICIPVPKGIFPKK
ncbi:hypothetical protein AB3R30_07275 [Leptolyngbyaceae cyanobacterium UHCC 1019]